MNKRMVFKQYLTMSALVVILNFAGLAVWYLWAYSLSDIMFSRWVSEALYYVKDVLYAAARAAAYSYIAYSCLNHGGHAAIRSVIVSSAALISGAAVSVIINLKSGNLPVLIASALPSFLFDVLLLLAVFGSAKLRLYFVSRRTNKKDSIVHVIGAGVAATSIIYVVFRLFSFIRTLIYYNFDITMHEGLYVLWEIIYIVLLHGFFTFGISIMYDKMYEKAEK